MFKSRGAVLLLSAFAVLTNAIGAHAQSFSEQTRANTGGGFLQEMRSLFNDPNLRDFVGSKIRQIPALQNRMLPPPSIDPYGSPRTPYGSSNGSAYQYDGGASPSFDSNANSPFVFSSRIRPNELNRLGQYDISILIDSSGSMNENDCPSAFGFAPQNVTRWQWCREQMGWFSQQIESAFPRGITLMTFSSQFQKFDHVSARDISTVFNRFSPDGGTNLHLPMREAINNYFAARDAGMQPKPLMLAVITDGDPSNKGEVRRIIKDAQARMISPNELKIVFFLIGADRSGQRFVDELDHELPMQMNVDIVSSHQFDEVNSMGLGRTLAQALR
ncbi:MAG: VWA domain-containing protein [Candidatus Obscuribacterales bacterium]|jgi:hypothetical protein|nr:VWA domain-containing protein [Candidatus Obscuribacterales bacterium]